MRTIIAAAALAAYTSASILSDDGYLFDQANVWYFKVGYAYELDAKYGTDYMSGQQDDGFNSYTYATYVKMFGWGSIDLEFLDWNWYDTRAVVDFFDIKPFAYTQTYSSNYQRVGGDFACSSFWYRLKFLENYVKHFENMKVCTGSLMEMVDAGEWVNPMCDYDDSKKGEWVDGYFYWNPWQNSGWESWYGDQVFYSNCL